MSIHKKVEHFHSFIFIDNQVHKSVEKFFKNEAIEFNNSQIIQAVGHLCVKEEHTLSPWKEEKVH